MNLQGKIITALGDSITEGVGTSAPEFVYQNILGRLVGAAKVHNFGVSGTRIANQSELNDPYPDTIVNRARRMPDDADLVLVLGGTNDYGHGDAPFGELTDRTADTFCGACHVLCSELVEKYPSAQIVIMTPLQRVGQNVLSPATGRPLIDYVDAIIAVAAEYSLPVLDLYRTSGMCMTSPSQQELFMPDGLHPNDAGAGRMAERLAGFLSAL